MEKTRIIEPFITSLKYSYEDGWLENYALEEGQGIDKHPLYLALKGNIEPLIGWCNSRDNLEIEDRLDKLFEVYKSLILNGQLEPIVITKDNVIVTGHKRSCCFLNMGKEKIKAIYEKI